KIELCTDSVPVPGNRVHEVCDRHKRSFTGFRGQVRYLPARFPFAETSAISSTASLSLRLRSRFVDRQLPAHQLAPVHVSDDLCKFHPFAERYKPEAARLSCIAIRHDLHFLDGIAFVGEQIAQVVFRGVKTEVSDK